MWDSKWGNTAYSGTGLQWCWLNEAMNIHSWAGIVAGAKVLVYMRVYIFN